MDAIPQPDVEYANVADKMEWRFVIMRRLEIAHALDRGDTKFEFMNAVDQAVSCVGVAYPGWNARQDTKNEISRLRKNYQKTYQEWLEENPTARRSKRIKFEHHLLYNFHKDILAFLDDYVGERRMLLFGKPDSRGVSYLEE